MSFAHSVVLMIRIQECERIVNYCVAQTKMVINSMFIDAIL